MALRAAGRKSLVDTVVEQLRDQLTDGEWSVGDRIPTEHVLAEQLGVGRNTVREAVRVLVHAGLLESRQGNGTFVRSTADPAAVLRGIRHAGALDVLELRVALEAEAARLAATRRDDDDLRALRAALAKLHEQGDRAADADLAFHLGIVEATHNAAFTEVYRFFSAQVHESLVTSLGDHEMPPIDLVAHAALVDAVESGDPAAAEQAARSLLQVPIDVIRGLVGR
ncbi:FadR family transcriptional regulator [Streptomyces sp. NBC_00237]|uniref:FadR/GntR family transcriptional regulator n=1 Tax=Streptomyces sp. NBC_00237 TaxID=2975687 RepID=UPI00224CFEAF|nr:FadR/GntR family transcriptional regulator [Streptomyces sp. NBC_00237]MCX5199988.1 FadR family transcriptional regulator [Streptomyces sp. NBC_00237]